MRNSSVAVHDAGKVVLLSVITVALLGLVAFGRAEWTEVEPLMWGLIGYTAGNGALAVSKQQPSPMFGHRDTPRRRETE